jgi:hypothetical protein
MSVSSESYHPTDRNADRPLPGAESSGWIAFAAILLFINGCFTGFWGLAAVLNDEVVTVGGGAGVVIWDVTLWGWATIVLAILMIVTSIGLFTGNSMARWLAVVFATINALVQFAVVTAFPLWAIMVIVIDLVIIYQLFAHWRTPETRVAANPNVHRGTAGSA